MTEEEWMNCSDPGPMLRRLIRSKKRTRKLRLFSVACCRLVWDLLPDLKSQRAVETAEMLADQLITEPEVIEIRDKAYDVANAHYTGNPNDLDYPAFAAAITLSSDMRAAKDVASMAGVPLPLGQLRGTQVALLRCIFGNPFRPVAFDPVWLPPRVTALAQTIYDERRFADMPILADALEEAGCTSQELLDHCRNPGKHVRGCWVVDLVLAKE